MNRAQKIAFLVANEEAWKSAKSQEILNGMEDAHVDLLFAGAQRKGVLENMLSKPAKIVGQAGALAVKFALNDANEIEGEVLEETVVANADKNSDQEPDEDDMEGKKKPKENVSATPTPAKVPTTKEWLESAPLEIREIITNAFQVEREAKLKEVEKLVANVANDQRPTKRQYLMKKSLTELRELASLIAAPAPVKNKSEDDDPFALLSSPAIGAETVENEAAEPLMNPTYNAEFNYGNVAQR